MEQQGIGGSWQQCSTLLLQKIASSEPACYYVVLFRHICLQDGGGKLELDVHSAMTLLSALAQLKAVAVI